MSIRSAAVRLAGASAIGVLCLTKASCHPRDPHAGGPVEAPAASVITIRIEGDKRVIESNGIPDHKTGRFPHPGNPSRILEQKLHFEMPVQPKPQETPVSGRHMRIGVALNGVVFDPVTAEFWNRNPEWNYETIVGGQRRMGLDHNNAHVQPTGTYHYHGMPIDLAKKLGADQAMVQVGWAADGFPIYGPMAYRDPKNPASGVAKMKSSYRLKEGERPGGAAGPGGKYDGTFSRDYEYVEGLGDLDECNGRFGATPEFPSGTYYYVITEEFPYLPRKFRGAPDSSFRHPEAPGHGRPPFPPGARPAPLPPPPPP